MVESVGLEEASEAPVLPDQPPGVTFSTPRCPHTPTKCARKARGGEAAGFPPALRSTKAGRGGASAFGLQAPPDPPFAARGRLPVLACKGRGDGNARHVECVEFSSPLRHDSLALTRESRPRASWSLTSQPMQASFSATQANKPTSQQANKPTSQRGRKAGRQHGSQAKENYAQTKSLALPSLPPRRRGRVADFGRRGGSGGAWRAVGPTHRRAPLDGRTSADSPQPPHPAPRAPTRSARSLERGHARARRSKAKSFKPPKESRQQGSRAKENSTQTKSLALPSPSPRRRGRVADFGR